MPFLLNKGWHRFFWSVKSVWWYWELLQLVMCYDDMIPVERDSRRTISFTNVFYEFVSNWLSFDYQGKLCWNHCWIQDLLDEFIAFWRSVTAAFCMENIWFILALILLNSFFSSSDLYWNSIWVNFKDNVPSFKPLTPNVILINYIWRQCFKQETWSNRFSHSFWKHDARRSKYLLLNLNWKFCIFF